MPPLTSAPWKYYKKLKKKLCNMTPSVRTLLFIVDMFQKFKIKISFESSSGNYFPVRVINSGAGRVKIISGQCFSSGSDWNHFRFLCTFVCYRFARHANTGEYFHLVHFVIFRLVAQPIKFLDDCVLNSVCDSSVCGNFRRIYWHLTWLGLAQLKIGVKNVQQS